MSEWVNKLPFAWLLIGVLALSYIAATAVYTRVMMLVIDRRGRVVAKKVRADLTSMGPAPPEAIALRSQQDRTPITAMELKLDGIKVRSRRPACRGVSPRHGRTKKLDTAQA